MSPSVGHRSPKRRDTNDEGRRSPRRRSPSRRERSPDRHRSSPRTKSPVKVSSHRVRSPTREKERTSSRGKSPKRQRLISPAPHTKQSKHSREEDDKVVGREHGGHRSREHDKDRHKERSGDREVLSDRSERRSGRDKKDEGSSRSRHKRSTSPVDHERSMRPTSGSPSRPSRSRARDEVTSPRGDESRDENDPVAMMKAAEEALDAKKKQEPSFELSGKLAAETNRVKGVTLLFNEPSDARKPDIRWRLYVFKAGEVLNEPLYIHRQTCYLFGRERRVADVPTDHPSCSKQHAVIQFRQVEKEQPDGMLKKQVRPYLMDLGSTNGTFLNENRIEPERYYELFERDTIKFGNSR
ncbi:hypothetical protein IFM89_005652 [Coptis chinensis]|uniref:FHA domain-containing protein n=1 Tax=Coptis chinensis TaxID=261450 RepID=A0A835GX60_9MAGN|nr:hypothetical protein IFM89_005652 [Coptis chinensis]